MDRIYTAVQALEEMPGQNHWLHELHESVVKIVRLVANYAGE